jgi:thymidylate synthase
MGDYSEKQISDCSVDDTVLCYDFKKTRPIPTKIVQTAITQTNPFKIELENGNKLTVSSVHPLYVPNKGWVQCKDLTIDDHVGVFYNTNHIDFNPEIKEDTILVSESDIRQLKLKINHDKIIRELKKRNLLPFKLSNPNAGRIMTLMGYFFGDGWLGSLRDKELSPHQAGRIGFGGEYSALVAIKNIINDIGFSCGKIHANHGTTISDGRTIEGTSLYRECSHTALWILFYCLGVPVGKKTNQNYIIPKWIMNSDNKTIITCFLTGFADAEMSAPYKNSNSNECGIGAVLAFKQNKDKILEDSLNTLIKDIQILFNKLDIDFYKSKTLYKKEIASAGLHVSNRETITKYLNLFTYVFSESKQYRANLYKIYYDKCIQTMKDNNVKNLSGKHLESYKIFLNGKKQRNMMFSKITKITKLQDTETLYDIAVEHPDHNFIGNGILCHNTYHERLRKYTVPGIPEPIDQIQYVIDTLKECKYSRRAQAVTWKAWEDNGIHDPSCLQRMFFRVINDKLQLNVHMRSNDAFKANFMNMFGFTDLQRIVAEAIGVPVGKYIHIVDSFHLYSSYFTEIEGFFKTLNARTFEERTYRTDDPMIIELFDEAKIQIAESLQREKETGRKGL